MGEPLPWVLCLTTLDETTATFGDAPETGGGMQIKLSRTEWDQRGRGSAITLNPSTHCPNEVRP
jgi:hypothetical protein